jgi:hypothetical protein
MTDPDPERQNLAERDRETVINCDHAVLELDSTTTQYPHGRMYIDVLTCMGCPTEVVMMQAQDPRDDIYRGHPLGN